MLWITLAAMCITASQQPANEGSGDSRANIAVGAAMLGLTPNTAAAAGLTPAQVGDLVSTVAQRNIVSEVTQPTPNSRTISGSDRSLIHNSSAFAALVGDICRQVCVVSGVDQQAAARLNKCAAADRSGLPAEWGAACADQSCRRAAARALVAERRAARLNRPLDSAARGVLEQIRGNSETLAAAERIRTNADACRQVIQR